MILAVGSFTYLGVQYDRFFNTAFDPSSPKSSFVQVIGSPQLENIAPEEHGETAGNLVIGGGAVQCDGTTQYIFSSKAELPFFYATKSIGGCNPPECDINIVSVTVTNETSLNGKNGTSTINATSTGGGISYSIDNINFGAVGQNVFDNLAPASYVAYVKDENGCTTTKAFQILAYVPTYGCNDPSALNYDPDANINDGSCIYPDPSVPANEDNNLYEQPDEFRLIYSGNTYRIDEPKDWDKITIVLKRDTIYHGVNYEFTDGDIKLRFDDDSGRQILQTAWNTDGNDADMRLQFGKDRFGQFIPDFDGYVDFNTYEKQENFILIGVKRKTFNDLLETRADTLVSLVDKVITLPLHSKLIRKQTIVNTGSKTGSLDVLSVHRGNGNGTPPPSGGSDNNLSYWNYIDFTDATQNDLCPDAPLGGHVYVDNPINTGQYIFKTDGGGTFDFSINFSLVFHIKLNSPFLGNPDINNYTYRWYLCVNGFTNHYELPGSLSGFQDGQYFDKTYYTSYTKTLTLNQGDEVYLFGEFVCNDDGNKPSVNTHIDQIFQKITISGDTLGVPTTTKAYMAYELADEVMKSVTDGQAYLKSNLLGRTDLGYAQDGCASLLSYTNGYQIRGFDIANRPIQIAFKDWIAGLNSLYCVGMGYELDPLGKYLVRIEAFDYFYQDTEIIFLDGVSNYVEDITTDWVYNELEFGYKKFTNNLPQSSNTLDEFCTDHIYLTPIQSFKQKLVQQCNQIASGYAIELTRRLSFAETPDDSWTYDEDNFVISTVRDNGGYKSEQAENFAVAGIIGAATAYNLRLSVKRMLDRWGRLINSAFAFKKPSDILTNTYVAKNGDLVSKLLTPDTCDSTQAFTESGNLTLGAYHGFDKLFFPVKITFGKRVSWDTMRYFRRCFQNQDTGGHNNGYISVVDCDGVTQQGYLTELTYNPESEYATFTLRKKYVDLSIPFDCSQYANYTFGDFEASSGIPIEIEQCLFENFA